MSKLRERAEDAASVYAECGDEWRTISGGKPCPGCESHVLSIADAIEREAKAFAERALRSLFVADEYSSAVVTVSEGKTVTRTMTSSNYANEGHRETVNEAIAAALRAAEEMG